MSYLTRVAARLSQGINCALLNGSPDQTVSARAYVNRSDSAWAVVYHTVNVIFFWQEDHSRDSHQADVNFAREVLETREAKP